MTATNDFEARLAAWLDADAPEYAPPGLVAKATAITATKAPWPAWRVLPASLARPRSRPARAIVFVALLVGLLLAALLVLSVAGSRHRLPAPFGIARPGLIASAADGHIYLVNADGSGRRQLTSDPGIDQEPSWSRDGTLLAYWTQPSGVGGSLGGPATLVVVNADGSDPRSLAEGVQIQGDSGTLQVQWSPDGRQIAYTNQVGNESRIEIVALNGTAPRVLATFQGPASSTDVSGAVDPQWSPDGLSIAYASLSSLPDGHAAGLRIVSAAGTDDRQLVASTSAQELRWAPDGLRLAYVDDQDGSTAHIKVVDRVGRSRTIATVQDIPMTIAWAPDGTHIAFNQLGPDGVVLQSVDGSDRVTLPIKALGADGPVWSPDGARVIGYVNGPGGQAALVVADVAGIAAPLTIGPSFNLDSPGGTSWQRLAP